ncbi:MAG: glycosyltransferase family 2 protein, partial [Elusimicrobiota bacterium]
MKVSGFTFVRNAQVYDFPVVESIKSMLPVCDEVYVNVGISDDNTMDMIKSIKSDKLKIFETEWDPKFKKKGKILAQQTNMALYKCRGDWCIYLQADEVLHEKDCDAIRKCMEENLENERIEGLLLNYYHFFGDFEHYARSYHWYQNEIRIVRNRIGVSSWESAQGFRIDGRKLRVKKCPAHVYHYGWVRDPYKMKNKKEYHYSLHHGNETSPYKDEERFIFEKHIDPYMIDRFKGEHPKIMQDRIK